MTTIASALALVRARLEAACLRAGRPAGEVALLAVSKTFGPDAVREAHAAGQLAFGENYIQEAVDKIAALADLPLQWHCIGPIQSNKTRLVAAHFDWVHSIDRLKIAQRLSEQRDPTRAPLQVCIQVNADAGPNKSGVRPEEAGELAHALAALPGLRLRGLMAIPEPDPDPAAQLAVLGRVAALFRAIGNSGLPASTRWDTLSLGMSADLEAAVLAGSTMVRVGTAIFGTRPARTG
jgi:PLP dependent protein